MSRNQISVRLKPMTTEGSQSTWISLSGPVMTTSAAAELAALFAMLSRWNSGPLRVVLSAGGAASWHDRWREGLAALPRANLEIRDRRNRENRQSERNGDTEEQQLPLFHE